MKVNDYVCNICGERLVNCDELIGITQNDKCEWERKPIEEAEQHICRPCFEELYRFWSNFEEG